jgi:hypothetical protein
LDSDHLFVCPGNHDVQRTEVDRHKYLEAGLANSLTDRDAVNAFIDDLQNQQDALARMTNFERFRRSFPNKFELRSSELFSTYNLNKHGRKIGIACINSAWRAYGGPVDYGKLLIGERTIDSCIEDLASCDLRIGVIHHPFEYLQEFERVELKRRIFGAFNIWLIGHTHEPDFDFVQTFNSDSIVVVTGGALYHTRQYYNGYSLIQFSFGEATGQVHLREYDDRARRFLEASAYAANKGIESFRLAQRSTVPLSGNLSLIAQIRSSVVDSVNRLVLPFTSELRTAAKDLRNVFVEPPLSIESEYRYTSSRLKKRSKKEESFVELEDVLRSDKNILFLGKKESGKSTLLSYVLTRYLDPNSFDIVRIPLLINYRILPKGKNRIKKALLNFMADYSMSFDLEGNLQQGNCLILIDDFEVSSKEDLAHLIKFTQTYPKNRFILAGDESLFLDEEFFKPQELGVEYERLYIHSFGPRQIRSLVSKWFEGVLTDPQVDELASALFINTTLINIPSTPLTISLMLLIIEQQTDFVPINKASLLEKLIEIVLQKTKRSEEAAGGIDYRNKEHFLSYLASHMVLTGNYRLTVDELRQVTDDYFGKKGLIVPRGIQSFIDDLVSRGILLQDGGYVCFRFRCFGEFFIAKHMIEDKSFYEKILSEEAYLAFVQEIDYLTRLQRNNRDLVELIRVRLQKSLDGFLGHIGLAISPEHFDRIKAYQRAFDTLSQKEKQALSERFMRAELDIDREEIDVLMRNRSDQTITKVSYEDYRSLVMHNLLLFCTVVKNCELIDDKPFKRESVNVCIQCYLKILFLFHLSTELLIDQLDNAVVMELLRQLELDIPGNEQEARDTLRITTVRVGFQIFQEILYQSLGTPKLRIVLEDEIRDPNNHVSLRLVCALLYADLRLPGAINKLEGILKEVRRNRFYREILVMRLTLHYLRKLYPANELRQIENLIADTIAEDQGIPRSRKSQIIQGLKNL